MAQVAGLPTPLFRRMITRGYFAFAFALRRLEQAHTGVSPELLQWCGADTPRIEAAWRRSLDAVKASQKLCRDRGIQFVLLYLRSELEVNHALDPKGTRAR